MEDEAKDSTSDETLEIEETSDETAEDKETSSEATEKEAAKETREPKVDYSTKFKESQKEALRLLRRVQDLEGKKRQPTEIPADIEKVVEQKVREHIAPLQEQQVKDTIDRFLGENPEARDHLKNITDTFQGVPGSTIYEKLENAYLIAKKDTMRAAGKKEMAFAFFQREQAAAGGGVASSPATEDLPLLTEDEKKVARRMGVTEEAYAKRKVGK